MSVIAHLEENDFVIGGDPTYTQGQLDGLTVDKTGRFVFLCDNFCGDGHDRMTGFIVVSE